MKITNIQVQGTLHDEPYDLWINTHSPQLELCVVIALSRLDALHRRITMYVFSGICEALAREYLVTPFQIGGGYRTLTIDCDSQEIHLPAVDADDQARSYQGFDAFINDVHFRNFHPTAGDKVEVVSLQPAPVLPESVNYLLGGREKNVRGHLLGVIPTEGGILWMVSHDGVSGTVAVYRMEELLPVLEFARV